MIFKNFLDEDYEYPRHRRNSYRDRYLNEDDGELDYQTKVKVFNDFKESLYSDLASIKPMMFGHEYLETVYNNLVKEYKRVLKRRDLPDNINEYFRVNAFCDKFIENMSMYKPDSIRMVVANVLKISKDLIDDSVVESLIKSSIKSFLDNVNPTPYVRK